MKTLDLVLTHYWYDEVQSGAKRIEYRAHTAFWRSRIWSRHEQFTRVRFRRGYTQEASLHDVTLIDMGPCPYTGWDGEFIRIHFTDEVDP